MHSPEVDPGFFYGTMNVLTPEAVRRKIAELDAHLDRPLLIINGNEDSCRFDPAGERHGLDRLFFYWYRAPVRHSESILEPLCQYVTVHYAVTEAAAPERFGYAVWVRKME